MKMTSITEAKMICPSCFSVFITAIPETMIWERCTACLSHIWDADDLMMADFYVRGHDPETVPDLHAAN